MTTTSEPQAPPPPPTASPPYPLRVRGDRDPVLSRWLWLVKWILAVPHWIVLAFLWVAFGFVTVVAFVSILVSARYPRVLFDFAVGVLRWSWRVAFYTTAAFGTDRYPPFTLRSDPDYPADLEIGAPERLSRGLVLVKWWLLALPQYVVVGLLTSSPWWVVEGQDYRWTVGVGGLVGLLAFVGIITYALTGSYPRALLDLIIGLDRWVLRVAAYATLMTDRYPPFRLDQGPREPEIVAAGGEPGQEAGPGAGEGPAAPGRDGGSGWSTGPVLALVFGALLCLAALPPLAGGVSGVVADATARDQDGVISIPPARVVGAGFAVRSPDVLLEPAGPTMLTPAAALGSVRVRATAVDPARPVFAGVAPRSAVDRYLAGTAVGTLDDTRSDGTGGRDRPVVSEQSGGPPGISPLATDIWAVQSSGPGTQTISWRPVPGDWTLVIMQPDGRPGVDVAVDGGATVPGLGALALWLLAAAAVLIAVGAALVVAAVSMVHRRRRAEGTASAGR